MNWKIGQKVVCVAKVYGDPDEIQPVINEIYTIRDFLTWNNELGIYLKEIVNSKRDTMIGFIERPFVSVAFRPIVDIGDEVEEYIKSKITEPEYA